MRGTNLLRLLFLALLCALPPLSIDMGLPSLPAMGVFFGVRASTAALSVTLFMAGFALSPIIYGVLSDRWGRRPLLIAGLALFAAGGVACLWAPGLGWLLAARFVQGLGAGCGPTLAFAASRDRLSGRALGQRLALLTMLLNCAPIVAPSLGTLWLWLDGWRGSYVTLAIAGTLLLVAACFSFDETKKPADKKQTGVFTTFFQDIDTLRRKPDIFLSGLIYGLSAGAMFAYVSTSSLLFMQKLGASAGLYAGLFAMTGASTCLGAYVSGRALHKTGALRLIAVGQALMILGPIAAIFFLSGHVYVIARAISCMMVAMFGYGLIAPASAHATLDPVPTIAGTVSAMMNSGQMTCMAFSSLLAALLFHLMGGFGVCVILLAFALISGLCLLFLIKNSGTYLAICPEVNSIDT